MGRNLTREERRQWEQRPLWRKAIDVLVFVTGSVLFWLAVAYGWIDILRYLSGEP